MKRAWFLHPALALVANWTWHASRFTLKAVRIVIAVHAYTCVILCAMRVVLIWAISWRVCTTLTPHIQLWFYLCENVSDVFGCKEGGARNNHRIVIYSGRLVVVPVIFSLCAWKTRTNWKKGLSA